MDKKMMDKRIIFGYGFGLVVIAAGIMINYLGVGGQEYVMFGSVGLWLLFIGFITLMITTLQKINGKKKNTDERVEYIGHKASKVTFLVLIIAAFIIMIIDGISPIGVPYHAFMANLIAGVVLVYFIAFKVIEKKH
ncbi:MAG: DUF2178 domain-containing protein [Candidatus Woesearchaeota archaeon]